MIEKIEERLWVSARYIAKENGMDFTVPCATIVRDFIRAGTRNMERESRIGEEDFEEADGNLGKLVSEMVVESKKVSNLRPAMTGVLFIREGAFVNAKSLCPLWPFC